MWWRITRIIREKLLLSLHWVLFPIGSKESSDRIVHVIASVTSAVELYWIKNTSKCPLEGSIWSLTAPQVVAQPFNYTPLCGCFMFRSSKAVYHQSKIQIQATYKNPTFRSSNYYFGGVFAGDINEQHFVMIAVPFCFFRAEMISIILPFQFCWCVSLPTLLLTAFCQYMR